MIGYVVNVCFIGNCCAELVEYPKETHLFTLDWSERRSTRYCSNWLLNVVVAVVYTIFNPVSKVLGNSYWFLCFLIRISPSGSGSPLECEIFLDTSSILWWQRTLRPPIGELGNSYSPLFLSSQVALLTDHYSTLSEVGTVNFRT